MISTDNTLYITTAIFLQQRAWLSIQAQTDGFAELPDKNDHQPPAVFITRRSAQRS